MKTLHKNETSSNPQQHKTREAKALGFSHGKSKKTKSSHWNEIIDVVKSLGLLIAIALLLRASVVEAFKIPSESMKPTLQVGDHILVNKLSYGLRLPFIKETVWQLSKPERGDVVVFTLPDDPNTAEIDESDTNIIKRVLGLPGETIEVRGTSVFINGKLYEDPQAHWLQGGRKDFGPVLVPDDKILLLGDNRDFSKDSRYWRSPFLDISRVKGRAFFIYWSLHHWRRIFHTVS